MRSLVIPRNMLDFRVIFDCGNDVFDPFRLDEAVVCGHYSVTAPTVKAENCLTVFVNAYRHCKLIAVAVFACARHAFTDGKVYAAYFFKRALHRLPFKRELGGIIHMLQIAAAAPFKHSTRRIDAGI